MSAPEFARLEAEIDEALAGLDFDRAERAAAQYLGVAGAEAPDGRPAHSAPFRARYLAAQVALASGKLARTTELLEPLLPLAGGLPPALARRLWLLSAEALTRQGQHDAGRAHLTQAERLGSGADGHPSQWARELCIRLWLGHVASLSDELVRCASVLEREKDLANAVLLACEEGRAWFEHGDAGRAVECLRHAEQQGRGLGRDPLRAEVLLQLGRAEHLRGRQQAALDCYAEATTFARPGGWQRPEARLRRLLVLLDLNQWPQARAGFADLAREHPLAELPEELRGLAAAVSGLLSDDPSALADEELQAYRLAKRGDREAARALYRRAVEKAGSPERRARLALAVGLLAWGAGDADEAQRYLERAETLATEWDLPEVLWRALQTRGRMAAEEDGDDARARDYFERAVGLFEQQAAGLRQPMARSSYRQLGAGVLELLLASACRRGEPAKVFHYQELQRGRLLLELWRSEARGHGRAPLGDSPRLAELERELTEVEERLARHDAESVERDGAGRRSLLRQRQELLRQRDRLLDDFLGDVGRHGTAAVPLLPDLARLQQTLPVGTVYAAPAVAGEELFLLVARRSGSQVVSVGAAAAVGKQVEAFRQRLAAGLQAYTVTGRLGRRDLDESLAELGDGPLGAALAGALSPGERLLWVPDGPLHGLPVHALRRAGRYLIERNEVVQAFGGSLWVHQARTRVPWRRRLGPALVVAESPAVLAQAPREAEGVAATFWRSRSLHGPAGNRDELRRRLPRAGAVHFACHAYFDAAHPLAACVGLPSGESWRALDWLDEPVAGLPLVTLSACRSAEVAPLVGREVFGLATGLLAAGVRAVLAGLWPVPDDAQTVALMWRFYRHRLTNDLGRALALAQRDALAAPDASPLAWAVFGLFGDAAALPAPGFWRRWWQRWRQRRHARRFP